MNALVITYGLHKPWNMGEVVLSRNYIELLGNMYDNVFVLSIIDKVRGFAKKYEPSNASTIIFYATNPSSFYRLETIYNLDLNCTDLHVMHFPLMSIPHNILIKSRRVYVYQYSLRNLFDRLTLLRVFTLIVLGRINKKLNILTPSPETYSFCKRLGAHCFYVPVPIETNINKVSKKIGDPINITYIGHANYHRFPFDKILVAMKLLTEKYSNKFNFFIYLSKQGYTNYLEMYRSLKKCIKKLNIERNINVVLKNLEPNEKDNILMKNNIFLYPALTCIAVDPPLTVLEAMSYGNCIVSTDVQSLNDIVSKNKRGIIIRRDNIVKHIFNTLRFLLEKPEVIKEYGYNAWSYIKKVHNKRVVISRFKNFIY